MDVRMPGVDGHRGDASDRSPAGRRRPRVVMLTTFDLDEYVYDALRAGASGFLLKDARPSSSSPAIRVVAGGDALLAPSVTRRLIERVRRARPPPRRAPRPAQS